LFEQDNNNREGGAIVTESNEIYEKLKLLRSHGRFETCNYFSSAENMEYVLLGYNFRMSNITAALGVAQMGKVDDIIKKRREIAGYISNKLSDISEIILPREPDDFFHVYQMYTIRVKNGKRDDLAKFLGQCGIMTKVYFSPVHSSHFYRKVLKYKCKLPETEKLSEEVLTLPMHPLLTKEELDLITSKIESFYSCD